MRLVWVGLSGLSPSATRHSPLALGPLCSLWLRVHCVVQVDYCCMPQKSLSGERTPAERVAFDWMLENVSVLFIAPTPCDCP